MTENKDYEMKHVKDFSSFLNESMKDGNTAEVQGPPFSIHEKEPGDIVKVEGKEVEITKFNSWIKDDKAKCMSFEGKCGDEKCTVKYDDSVDGYVFVK